MWQSTAKLNCLAQGHFIRADVCWLIKQTTLILPLFWLRELAKNLWQWTQTCYSCWCGANRELDVGILTERIRSPLLSSPLRSAGPPARMKETKMPSPSSPPTMLKPRPVEPLCSNTFLGSLPKRATASGWRAGQRLYRRGGQRDMTKTERDRV